jgi:Flp pilus assembly protein TadD
LKPLLLQKSAFEEAIADFTEAIRLRPTLDVALSNRAISYEATGRLDQALTDYARAI